MDVPVTTAVAARLMNLKKGDNGSHHIRDVEDFPGHGFLVVRWRGSKPQLLECLVHQFLVRQSTILAQTLARTLACRRRTSNKIKLCARLSTCGCM